MLETIFIKNNLDASVSFESTKANDILEHVNKNSPQVIILDINLKDTISGLDLAKQIRDNNKTIYIIFTTAHLEYVMMAYKVKTFDFIAKPITIERLEETVCRLFNDALDSPNHYLRINNKSTVIAKNSINYIKRDGMKLVFDTDTREYEIYSSFNKIEKNLDKNFIRCHKSYIANTNKISDIDVSQNTIFFNDKSSCLIGPKYKTYFMEVIKNGIIEWNLKCSNYTKYESC